jgi:hypothetical protein
MEFRALICILKMEAVGYSEALVLIYLYVIYFTSLDVLHGEET